MIIITIILIGITMIIPTYLIFLFDWVILHYYYYYCFIDVVVVGWICFSHILVFQIDQFVLE